MLLFRVIVIRKAYILEYPAGRYMTTNRCKPDRSAYGYNNMVTGRYGEQNSPRPPITASPCHFVRHGTFSKTVTVRGNKTFALPKSSCATGPNSRTEKFDK